MRRISKHEYYLNIARAVSARSTCLKRRYGCVIVKDDEIIATGYNGAPRGCDNCCDIHTECPRKNVPSNSGNYAGCNAVHAEQNALLSAARHETIGATLYLAGDQFLDGKWQPIHLCEPCPICSNMIKNAGITEVIGGLNNPASCIPSTTNLLTRSYVFRHTVDEGRLQYIQTLLSMTGKELYDKYGIKRNETITETVCLPEDYEMDIKCCMPESEDEMPWTEAILFQNGSEIACSDVENHFEGSWELEDDEDNVKFTVIITKHQDVVDTKR